MKYCESPRRGFRCYRPPQPRPTKQWSPTSRSHYMGASSSSPSTVTAPVQILLEDDQIGAVNDLEGRNSPMLLEDLPLDILAKILSSLELRSLSAIHSSSRALGANIPDSVWHQHLDRLVRAGTIASEDVGLAEQPNRITNSVQRQAAIQVASDAAEAAAFLLALEGLLTSTASCRLQVARLRSLVCNLCQARPSGALYFSCIERGVCHQCIRTKPSVADSWRYHQSAYEAAAVARRDAGVAKALRDTISPHLPPSLRDVEPRLVFSSEVSGGSLATMLRCAQACESSVLVITVRDESQLRETGGESTGPRPRTGPVPRAAPKTILSPLALQDIQRRQTFREAKHRRPDRMFGIFCPVRWPRTPNERPKTHRFGGESSFIFTLSPNRRVYPAAPGSRTGCFRCDGERGIGVGGDDLLPALAISADFARGRCLSDHTFGDLSDLTSSTDEFPITLARLWDFTPRDDDDDGAGASGSGSGAIEEASVLTARKADALLLPFRTSMMLRVE